MADEIITQYLVPSSQAIPTVSDPHAPVGSFLRRDVLLHPFVEKDTVTVDGQERERVIIRMLPDYMTNPYVHKFVMYMQEIVDVLMGWKQRGSILTPSDAADHDWFGYSVAFSGNGDVLAIGARNWENLSDTDIGAVYIFDRSGNSWIQRGTVLTAPDAAASDWFGSSVALSSSGDVLAVGASNWEDEVGTDNGGVYIFDRSGSSWAQRGSVLVPSDSSAYYSFGRSVALSSDGSILVVGSPARSDETGATRGGVYTFFSSGSSWTQSSTVLKAFDAAFDDNFGWAVSLTSDGSRLVVGAPNWESGVFGYPDIGAVYTYTRSGDQWALEGSILNAFDYAGTDDFGSSVAISGDGSMLVVGARQWEGTTGINRGGVYTFDKVGDSWQPRYDAYPIILEASDAASNDLFGSSAALSSDGTKLAVGAYSWESSGTNRGSTYIYDWLPV